MALPDWKYPETWRVGDNLDADTLNRRLRDQTTILLRRPMLVATLSTPVTLTSGSDAALSFNTIVEDDDGMCTTGTPATCFYVQRDGAYRVWLNLTAVGNSAACTVFRTGIVVNGVVGINQTNRRWDTIKTSTQANGRNYCHSLTGTLLMSAGEYFSVAMTQNSGANMTLPVTMNTPRLTVMWLGVS